MLQSDVTTQFKFAQDLAVGDKILSNTNYREIMSIVEFKNWGYPVLRYTDAFGKSGVMDTSRGLRPDAPYEVEIGSMGR